MKKNKKYLVFLLASVMFAACNSASSPKGVVKSFIKDAESDDAWKIKNYILQNDDTVYVNKWIEEPGVNPQIKIKEQSINDDTTAIVEVTNYENRNIKIKLVKEKGEWKISNPIKLLSPLPEDPSIVVSKSLMHTLT